MLIVSHVNGVEEVQHYLTLMFKNMWEYWCLYSVYETLASCLVFINM